MRGLEVLAQREYEPGIDVKPSQRSGPLTTNTNLDLRDEIADVIKPGKIGRTTAVSCMRYAFRKCCAVHLARALHTPNSSRTPNRASRTNAMTVATPPCATRSSLGHANVMRD